MFKLFGSLPVDVRIENDVTTPNYQENLVLTQKRLALATVLEANRELDRKALGLLQVGGVIIGLVSVFNLVGGTKADSRIVVLFTGLTFVLFITMLVLSIWAMWPKTYQMPHTTNWDETFSKYLHVDTQSCFNQILSNLYESLDSVVFLNEYKSKRVQWVAWLLVGQAICLMVAVLA